MFQVRMIDSAMYHQASTLELSPKIQDLILTFQHLNKPTLTAKPSLPWTRLFTARQAANYMNSKLSSYLSTSYLKTKLFFVSIVFKDTNTPSPFIEKFPNDDGEGSRAAKPDHIYMDAMGFGMGCCCLQVRILSFCEFCLRQMSRSK